MQGVGPPHVNEIYHFDNCMFQITVFSRLARAQSVQCTFFILGVLIATQKEANT